MNYQKFAIICPIDAYRYFSEYINGLATQLGMNTNIIQYSRHQNFNLLNSDTFYFFCQVVPSIAQNAPNVCLINFEQLSRSDWANRIKLFLQTGHFVLDYDLKQSLTFDHPNHCYCPYQCVDTETQQLVTLVNQEPKQYDVVDCGTGSTRRARIIQQLRMHKISVKQLNGWGLERDRQIANAKILLNVHFNTDYNIFEHLRCDRWILAGMIVVSENSRSDKLLDLSELVILVPYDQIVNTIIEILKNYQDRKKNLLAQLTDSRETIIKNRKNIVQNMIARLPITHPLPVSPLSASLPPSESVTHSKESTMFPSNATQ